MLQLDLAAVRSTPLVCEPFPYLIVPGFVVTAARKAIHADYPRIDAPGSFPVDGLHYGKAFGDLLETLTGDEVREAFEEKFGIDLRGRPTMVTVRGRCGTRDGNIHTDATSKIITVLVYMNAAWEAAGGRLRLLRSAKDMEDVLVEVPPVEGTLVAFRRTDNSFHGHKTFIGPRRVIQLNWVIGRGTRIRELWRHRLSALVKRAAGLIRRAG
jgi:hypothetical protein